jgi:hypothetical protein
LWAIPEAAAVVLLGAAEAGITGNWMVGIEVACGDLLKEKNAAPQNPVRRLRTIVWYAFIKTD